MPDFELTGPDGAKFQVTAPDESSALSAFQQLNGGPAAKPAAAPISANDVVRATATGVPIAGGVLNKLNAATNAALAPAVEPYMEKSADSINDAPGATMLERFVNRYKKSLEIQDAKDAKFATEHPIVDTAAKIAGGVGATIPAVMAAPAAFGAVGTLPQMVAKGAASSAAISAADAAVRGEDVVHGAAVGGALGAGAPLAARAIGAAVRAVKPAPAVAPTRTAPVGTVDIPLSQSQVTGDAAQSAEEQILARGGRGERAQGVAQDFDALQSSKLAEATDEIAKGLDASGASARTAPQAAGERVIDELAQAEATRIATENARRARVAAQGSELRADVGIKTDPVTGAAVPVADSPYVAGETIGTGVNRAANAARQARTEAYRDYAAVPGEYEPGAFAQIGNSIRNRLGAGDSPVRVTENLTPRAHEALNILDDNVGSLRFQNDAQTGEMILDASGRPVPRPITGQTIEEARKELTQLYGDARRAAMGPGGTQADVLAMDRIITAFDNHVTDAAKAGAFSGDAAALQAAGDKARASHAAYRKAFTRQGPGDETGAAIENIIGRYQGQAATPDEIAALSYGSAADPGGGKAIRVAQRLRSIFGPDSPEWGAYKQGLISHVEDAPAGARPFTPTEVADRIDKMLTGTKGRGLAQVSLSADERAAWSARAEALRTTESPELTTAVDKTIAKIAGRDGATPMSGDEVVDLLVSRNATGVNKGFSAALADRLKRDLSPEGWTSVRQGLFSKVTEALPGKPELQAQALHNRLTTFLESDLAKTAYTSAERAKMESLAKVYKQLIPVNGTTNPSGSGQFLVKAARGMSNNLLTMLGAVHSGFVGAGVGYGMQKALAGVAERKGAKAATEAFYGSQPRAAIKTSRVPIILSQGAGNVQQRQ